MKKSTLFAVVFAALIVSMGLVSADDATQALAPVVKMLSGLITAVFEAIKPLLPFVFGSTSDEAVFFGKIAVAIILFSISYAVLRTLPFFSDASKNQWVLWVLSIVIPLLGIRYLPSEMMYVAFTSNSAFVLSLAAGFPFIMAFIFIERGLAGVQYRVARRFLWVLFGVVLFAMYISFADKMTGVAAIIYPLFAFLSVLMALLDGTLQWFFLRMRISKATALGRAGSAGARIRRLQNDLAMIHSTYSALPNAHSAYVGTIAHGGLGRTGVAAYYADIGEIERLIQAEENSIP